MNENNVIESSGNAVELDADNAETVVLDSADIVPTVSGGDAGTDEYILQSVSSGDASGTAVSGYTEEQWEMDSQIVGCLTDLNNTCTLLLFFLLFAWIERKVRFFMKGFGNGKSN